MTQVYIQKAEDQMKKVIERLQSEFTALRTGRASIALLDGIKAEYYGTPTPLAQMASVAVADARTLEIKPWDKEGLQLIEQAIMKSDLGITPQNDGKVLRLTLPTMTTERRKDLTKVVKKLSEEFRVGIRNVRRDAVEVLKKSEKDKQISKDELFKQEQLIQKLTDRYVKNVDDLLAAKEKEIMEV